MHPARPAPARFDVRLADTADALTLGVIGTQVFLDTYASDGIRPSLAREALASFGPGAIEAALADAATAFFVAEAAGGHLLGFVEARRGATHRLAPPGSSVELHRLYVLPRFASRGIGTALLRRAEAWASAHGSAALWLTAWIGNTRAIGFYRAQGYEDRGATEYTFEGVAYENRLFARPCHAEC